MFTDCTRNWDCGWTFNLSSCVLENPGMSARVIHHFRCKKKGNTPDFNRVLLCFYNFIEVKKTHSEITAKSCTTYKKCRHIRKNATGLPTLLYSSTYFIFYSWVKEQQHTNQHRISRLEAYSEYQLFKIVNSSNCTA